MENEFILRYSSVNECLEYFQEYNTKAFNIFENKTEQEISELLFHATVIIDNNDLKGAKKEKDQFLQWPRLINGEEVEAPLYYKYAIFETAYSLFLRSKNDLMQKTGQDISKVKSRTLDKLRIEYFESASSSFDSKDFIPVIANIYIKDYLAPVVKNNTYKNIRG